MTAKGRSLQKLAMAVLLFAVTAKTGLAQQLSTPTNSLLTKVANEAEMKKEAASWKAAFMTPIAFYGKVVDEKGVPIKEAKVIAQPADILNGSNKTYEKASDDEGLFSVTGVHGMGISIRVSKEGYYTDGKSSGMFGYASGSGCLPPHPNPNDPAIFFLRKMGQTEPLIMHSWNQAAVSKDGTPTTLNLYSGEKTQGSDSIMFEIWTQKPQDPKAPNPFAWKSRLSVPGGSLQIRKGSPYNFQAPTDGYVSEDMIEMTETSSNWRTRVTKDYYFKFSDGRYARATVGYYIGGFQFVNVTSYLNPQPGHTNLEYDTNQAASPTTPLHP